MFEFLTNIREIIRWQDLMDILLVCIIVYRVLLLIRGTRAVQMLTGFGIILIGRNPFFTSTNTIEEVGIVDEICRAALMLAGQKVGALVVLERETGLKNYIEAGVMIDAKVSEDLLVSIFHPSSPIHDGAVIIRNSRVSSAGCLLPISRDPSINKELGTRHRAALGLTHETDAVVVVVSEERGEISLVHHGTIVRDLDINGLRNQMLQLLGLRKFEGVLEKREGI